MKIGYLVTLVLYLRLIFLDEQKLSTMLKLIIGFGIVLFILANKYFKKKNNLKN